VLSGRILEVTNNGEIQTVSPKNGRGRLLEVGKLYLNMLAPSANIILKVDFHKGRVANTIVN